MFSYEGACSLAIEARMSETSCNFKRTLRNKFQLIMRDVQCHQVNQTALGKKKEILRWVLNNGVLLSRVRIKDGFRGGWVSGLCYFFKVK